MQHDTVMNFLNHGNAAASQNTAYSQPPQNLDQQLISVLKQQQHLTQKQSDGGPPVEFIIETKIKTIDSATGQPNSVSSIFSSNINQAPLHSQAPAFENKNYFMNTFETKQPSHQSLRQKQSSLIRIPLLNMAGDEATTPRLPYIETPVTPRSRLATSPPTKHKTNNFPLLDFKSENVNTSGPRQVSPNKLLTLDTSSNDNLNKHVKDFIQVNRNQAMSNYKNFPLLKLNYEPERAREVVAEKPVKPATPEPSSTPQTQAQPKTEPPPVKESKESKEAQVQVQKPMYDGYLIAPGAFDDMLNNVNEQVSHAC